MDVLITSKTHKGNSACVGGLILNNNRFVRLLNLGNRDQHANTDLNIGNVWDIQFSNRHDIEPPHLEDIIIQTKEYSRDIGDISIFLRTCGLIIYKGAPTKIFEGRLGWTGNGSGYIENYDSPQLCHKPN